MFAFLGSKRATNKGVSQSVKGKRQTLRKSMDVSDPDVGNNECEDVHENQDDPVLEGKEASVKSGRVFLLMCFT